VSSSTPKNLEPLPDFLSCDWVVPGVGDAGAHVGVIMDAGWTNFLLSYWHCDRGAFTIEQAVELLTSKQARVLGLSDRGSLKVGNFADINVLDVYRVEERQPQRVTDFPGGAPRLIQRAVGRHIHAQVTLSHRV
jgi:N-acyl-D-aspartate/D-glutamate deacylase